jgi:hypothetical protein
MLMLMIISVHSGGYTDVSTNIDTVLNVDAPIIASGAGLTA